jgi:hypothetical protein
MKSYLRDWTTKKNDRRASLKLDCLHLTSKELFSRFGVDYVSFQETIGILKVTPMFQARQKVFGRQTLRQI